MSFKGCQRRHPKETFLNGPVADGIAQPMYLSATLLYATSRYAESLPLEVERQQTDMLQLAVKYLAVLITIAELGSLVSGVITSYLIKRRSKLLDEPWRVKA